MNTIDSTSFDSMISRIDSELAAESKAEAVSKLLSVLRLRGISIVELDTVPFTPVLSSLNELI